LERINARVWTHRLWQPQLNRAELEAQTSRFRRPEPTRHGGCVIVPERLTEQGCEARYSPNDEPVA
jgi:hypothetical protein